MKLELQNGEQAYITFTVSAHWMIRWLDMSMVAIFLLKASLSYSEQIYLVDVLPKSKIYIHIHTSDAEETERGDDIHIHSQLKVIVEGQ